MILGIASYKGGVGKTTTAVHLAQYLSQDGSTLLLDGDSTRNATNWARRGSGFAFSVEPVEAAAMMEGFRHKVIDTGQKPEERDLLALARYVDLLLIPSAPATLDSDGLGQTIRALRNITRKDGAPVNFKVLFTRVAHHNAREIADLRESLGNGHVPMFLNEIPMLKAFDKAAAAGQLVRDLDDEQGKRAWEAYTAVGEELLHGNR